MPLPGVLYVISANRFINFDLLGVFPEISVDNRWLPLRKKKRESWGWGGGWRLSHAEGGGHIFLGNY